MHIRPVSIITPSATMPNRDTTRLKMCIRDSLRGERLRRYRGRPHRSDRYDHRRAVPVSYTHLILDEPTRGIDVGAKYEIYCIIADLAKQGKSIIMISSEMSEIIGMSNRVMVMCDGRITGFINGKDATQENIMALATQFETAPDAAAANQ